MTSKLPIFYKDTLAGVLEKTPDENFRFEYDDSYLASQHPAISLTFPKEEKSFKSDSLFPFFDGLIPEGWLLSMATKELRLNPLRDRFELLANLCHDTIGAVHVGAKSEREKRKILSSGTPLKESSALGKCLICYEASEHFYHDSCMLKVFGKKINPIVEIDYALLEKLAKNQLNKKLAISGVQKKLSLDFESEAGKSIRLTVTDLWGRFIFKPKGEGPHVPENEHLCLKLAQSSGIKVENAALVMTAMGELAFVAARFDRGREGEEYHQEDCCQILNKEVFKKYSGSLEQIGRVLKKSSDFPGDNLYRLYELTVFNFLIGNVDAHLKNISLTYENDEGVKTLLSPAYDLLSTDLFIDDDHKESALAINGKKNKIKESDFLALAQSFGISSLVHKRIILKFRNLMPTWFEIIEKSFLEQGKKQEFKLLIQKKMKRFSS